MAVVRFGDAGPVLGLQDETTLGFVQEFNVKKLFDEVMVDNNIGECVTFGLFNKRWEGQIVLIDKTSAGSGLPAAATTQIFANLSSSTYGDPSSSQVIITDHDRKPEQKGAQKHTFNFKAFVNFTS